MSNENGRGLKDAARDALHVQNACNASGVARSYAAALRAVREALPNISTGELARHPVSVLFAHKLASLAGIEPLGVGDFERYEAAELECRRLVAVEVERRTPLDLEREEASREALERAERGEIP